MGTNTTVPGATVSNATVLTATPLVFPAVNGPGGPGAETRQERQRGYTDGHTAGYTAGMRKAAEEAARLKHHQDAEHAALLAELRAVNAAQAAALTICADAVAATVVPVLADVEQTLFDCAMTLAQTVLGEVLDDAETSARAALSRVVGGGADVPPLRVRMNPRDVQALAGHSAGERSAARVDGLDIVADSSIAPGDAIADFADGFLDAGLTSALGRARQALQDART